jgi:hypothetical protein
VRAHAAVVVAVRKRECLGERTAFVHRALAERQPIERATDEKWLVLAASGELGDSAMYGVSCSATGWKADLIVRKARPFSIEELARRQPAVLSRRRNGPAPMKQTRGCGVILVCGTRLLV